MAHISGDRQSLSQWQVAIVISAVIGNHCFGSHRGIVISVATSDCYFGGNWRSLFRRRLAIVGRKLRRSTLANSKNCSPEVVTNTLCVRKKPTKSGSGRMVDQTLHVMLVGLLSLVQTKQAFGSHHVRNTLRICLYLHSIRSWTRLKTKIYVNFSSVFVLLVLQFLNLLTSIRFSGKIVKT